MNAYETHAAVFDNFHQIDEEGKPSRLNGFEKRPFLLHEPLHVSARVHKGSRATVVLVLACNNSLCLVQSAKDPQGRTFVLPQGGIENRETPILAAYREAEQELNLPEKALGHYGLSLGTYLNKLPPEREQKDKHLHFVGLYVLQPSYIRVRPEENLGFVWVRTPKQLQSYMAYVAENRPGKYHATCEAIRRAHEERLISWSV